MEGCEVFFAHGIEFAMRRGMVSAFPSEPKPSPRIPWGWVALLLAAIPAVLVGVNFLGFYPSKEHPFLGWVPLGILILACVMLARRFTFQRAKIGWMSAYLGVLLVLMGWSWSYRAGFSGQMELKLNELGGEVEVGGLDLVLGPSAKETKQDEQRFPFATTGEAAVRVLREEDATGPGLEVVDYLAEGELERVWQPGSDGDPPGVHFVVEYAEGDKTEVHLGGRNGPRQWKHDSMEVQLERLQDSRHWLAQKKARLGPGKIRWKLHGQEKWQEKAIDPLHCGMTWELGTGYWLRLLDADSQTAQLEVFPAEREREGVVLNIPAFGNHWKVVDAQWSGQETDTVPAAIDDWQYVPDLRIAGAKATVFFVGQRFWLQLQDHDGLHRAEPWEEKGAVVLPAMGIRLRMLESWPQAYAAFKIRPAKDGQTGLPTMRIRVRRLGQEEDVWLQKGKQILLGLAEGMRSLRLQARKRELPFSIVVMPEDGGAVDFVRRSAGLPLRIMPKDTHRPSVRTRLLPHTPFDYLGYRMQLATSSYFEGKSSPSILRVIYDPGQNFVYAGCVFLLLSLIWFLLRALAYE